MLKLYNVEVVKLISVIKVLNLSLGLVNSAV